MDTMARYMVEDSIKDVIDILDSAPLQVDMLLERNLVQLTNRAPIAHLAMERGLKALITEVSGTWGHIHGLDKLYRALCQCGPDSAAYLAKAFEDAVKFFGYNVNAKGFSQLRSLDDYLSKVGTEKAFNALRYWAIGDPLGRDDPIQYLSHTLHTVHREILCALQWLFHPNQNRRQTVSQRVEGKVRRAMFNGRDISWGSDDTDKKLAFLWYENWLFTEHTTCLSALEDAVDRDFTITDCEIVSQTLREAYDDLKQSKDPAVRYYIRKLSYLPKGSQQRNPDAVAEVEWYNDTKTSGMTITPAGTHLGFIKKYPDGSWEIIPEGNGLRERPSDAKSLADAKRYLVNRLTKPVTVTVEGRAKQLRIVSESDSFNAPAVWIANLSEPMPDTSTFELEFWDAGHGLCPGDAISIVLSEERNLQSVSVLEGTVTMVAEQKVSIDGTEITDVKRNR